MSERTPAEINLHRKTRMLTVSFNGAIATDDRTVIPAGLQNPVRRIASNINAQPSTANTVTNDAVTTIAGGGDDNAAAGLPSVASGCRCPAGMTSVVGNGGGNDADDRGDTGGDRDSADDNAAATVATP